MTRIQEIQAKIKVENSRHKAEVAKLKALLEAARADKKAKAGAKKAGKKGAEANADEAVRAAAWDAAKKKAKEAKERMKRTHPDHGGAGGAAFHNAYATAQAQAEATKSAQRAGIDHKRRAQPNAYLARKPSYDAGLRLTASGLLSTAPARRAYRPSQWRSACRNRRCSDCSRTRKLRWLDAPLLAAGRGRFRRGLWDPKGVLVP